MMLQKTTDKKLESFKIFPYVAWGLIVLFVFFVYRLTTNLNATATELETKSNTLEALVETNDKDLKNKNFEQ